MLTGFINYIYGTNAWMVGIIVTAITVGVTVMALVVVDHWWSKELRRSHNDIAGFLIAVVGVIFAILISSLAITVLARNDRADSYVVEEADTVAALAREGLLFPEAERKILEGNIRTYLDAVIEKEWPQMRDGQQPTAAASALQELWQRAASMPVENLSQLMKAQDMRRHLDHLFDVRRGRATLATTGVDPVVWSVVLLGSASTIMFAVLFGVRNFAAHLLMSCLLAFSIALVLIMIVAMDWPYYGEESIGSGPLETLRAELRVEAAPRN